MSSAKRTCGGFLALVLIAPAIASGQSVSSAHRPWAGFSMGTGFVGGDHVEPDDSRDLGLSLAIPLRPVMRIQVGAGRMRVNGARFGEFPWRRFTFDGVVLRPFSSARRACQSHFVAGGGIGLYHYDLGSESSATRRGYQVFAGGECIGRRASFALEITGRSIRGPANLLLPDAELFALDMHLAVKLRL